MREAVILGSLLLLAPQPVHAQTADPTAPAATQSSTTDWAAAKAEADAQAAAFNAAKAAADARTAMIAAEVAADRAAVGSVNGQTSIQGTTTVGAGTSQAAAMLLVSRSTSLAAAELAERLRPKLFEASGKSLLVVTDMAQLSTNDLVQFENQVAEATALMSAAQAQFQVAKEMDRWQGTAGSGSTSGERSALTTAGAVLDVASRLGSYFQSDYSFLGVEPTTPGNATITAVVSALLAENVTNTIIVPSNYLVLDQSAITTPLASLRTMYASTAAQSGAAKGRSAALKTNKDAGGAVAAYDAADALATRALAAYDAIRTALGTVADGQSMATRVLRQQQIRTALGGISPPLVLLVDHAEAAELYTQKNLWTFLGGPPLHTMGGVAMTYTLFDPKTGGVAAAGSIARHGGYRSVSDVEDLFDE